MEDIIRNIVREILSECFNNINESVDEDTLSRMRDFGMDEGDIDGNGYVTLYHGGIEMPDRLNPNEIFFLTNRHHHLYSCRCFSCLHSSCRHFNNVACKKICGSRRIFRCSLFRIQDRGSTNLLGTLTQPDKTLLPFIFTVTNLLAGNHELRPQLIQGNQASCLNPRCLNEVNIRVVDLGLKSIRVDSSGAAQIEVVTAFPGKPTVIPAPADEFTWVSLSTNVPSTNFFQFTDPDAKNHPRRYYRALVFP